ncbi:hypothetical protein L323_09895 [Ruminiclostridium papyrosolvens C7]|uniref:Uncharacterized protein n=1 Tax=Ruminiclostridium papyrosolvens C7 TaxID=1330534 RepID=U4R1J8_9FIRM|nr:hypothetical protein L323_09895 [Ruminiclostridium papyrosolvens C7]
MMIMYIIPMTIVLNAEKQPGLKIPELRKFMFVHVVIVVIWVIGLILNVQYAVGVGLNFR